MTDADHRPEPDEPRPWERQGVVRRDVAPHRANWLMLLATVAVLLGVSSFLIVVTGWPGFLLAVLVRHLADVDLAGMQAGRVAPEGRAETEAARNRAVWAMFTGAFGGMACGLPVLLLTLQCLFR
jgi:hypothetical protein